MPFGTLSSNLFFQLELTSIGQGFNWSAVAIFLTQHASFFLNCSCSSKINFEIFFNSRTLIAGAIIGLLLVFYDSKRSIGFLSVFFLQEVDLFTRHFDLKAKVRKAVSVNRFSLSEKSFLIMRFV